MSKTGWSQIAEDFAKPSMTDEKAIEILETIDFPCRHCPLDYMCRKAESGLCNEAFEIAAQAIRERIEREKGCEYCNDEKRMVARSGHAGKHGFYLAGNALTYSQQVAADDDFEDDCFINFCPMCGRELKPKEVQDER